ncbi:hypothetical protein ABK040_002256 [Willaertia magna]
MLSQEENVNVVSDSNNNAIVSEVTNDAINNNNNNEKPTFSLPAIKGRRGLPVEKDKFIEQTHKQFKINLNEKIPKGETVLVCYSGGSNSNALIQMLKNCVSPNPNWKLHFKWEYLYIDIGAIVKLNKIERDELNLKIKDICENLDENNKKIHIKTIEELLFNNNENEMLDFIFKKFTTKSVQEDLLRQLIKKCIFKFAKEFNFNKILTGESANHMAIHILSDVCKGRGYSLPLEIQLQDTSLNGYSFSEVTDSNKEEEEEQINKQEINTTLDEKENDLVIIRPMRNFLGSEIAIYNRWHNMDKFTFCLDITTKNTIRQSSIHRLVEDFVCGLQKDYPSTVHTIIRTIEKLKVPTGIINNEDGKVLRCSICSSLLSEDDLNFVVKDKNNNSDGLDENSLSQYCCFGCKRNLCFYQTNSDEKRKSSIAADLDDVLMDDELPSFVKHQQLVTRNQMRKCIEEFLVVDEEQ